MAEQGLQNGSVNDKPTPLNGSMTPLPVLLPRSAPHPCTSSFSLSHAACSWGTPTPGSGTAHLWDTFAHLHSKQVSENSLCLASLCLEGKEKTSRPS